FDAEGHHVGAVEGELVFPVVLGRVDVVAVDQVDVEVATDVHAQADAGVTAVGLVAVLAGLRFGSPIAGADQAVDRVVGAEVEAAGEADALELRLGDGDVLVAGAVEAAGGQLDAQQGDGAGLPAVAAIEGQHVLVHVLVDPALASLGTNEEAATVPPGGGRGAVVVALAQRRR